MDLNWDDLKLFLAVARLGGLRAAAPTAGLSAPSLGRRITLLERQLANVLFERSLSGYVLTEAGVQLMEQARDVEAAVQVIVRWQEGSLGDRLVRVSAGAWMSDFLSAHVSELWSVGDRIRVELVTTFDKLDVGRRAVDIDFRLERPDEPGTARRRVGTVAYALYSGRKRINGVAEGYFVGVTGDASGLPMSRWLEAHHGDRVGVRGNDVHAVLRLVVSGAGLSVFPCFIGDADDRLVRLGAPIEELTHDLWLVTHGKDRHDPAVRLVSQRIGKLLVDNAELLRGAAAADMPRSILE